VLNSAGRKKNSAASAMAMMTSTSTIIIHGSAFRCCSLAG
jgi:hypothetical protein